MAWGERPPPAMKPRKRRGSSIRDGREGVGPPSTGGDAQTLSGVDVNEGVANELKQRVKAMQERRTSRRRESVLRENVRPWINQSIYPAISHSTSYTIKQSNNQARKRSIKQPSKKSTNLTIKTEDKKRPISQAGKKRSINSVNRSIDRPIIRSKPIHQPKCQPNNKPIGLVHPLVSVEEGRDACRFAMFGLHCCPRPRLSALDSFYRSPQSNSVTHFSSACGPLRKDAAIRPGYTSETGSPQTIHGFIFP